MKNREKYAEEIKKYKGSYFCSDFIKPYVLKSNDCYGMSCEKCRMLQLLWLEEEYTEPIIDWSKVYTWYGEEKLDYARILTNAEAEKWDKWKDLEKQGRLIVTPETGIGDLSDGYHTFNELYHHRAVLFSVICNSFKSLAWKSKKHNDGTMYNGMFIVGIATPKGNATYHYDIEPYWNMFDVKELDKAPEWDGHTPSEAIERISKLAEMEGAE